MLQVRVCRIAGDAELLADVAGVAFGDEQPECLGLAPCEFAALDKLCSSETTENTLLASPNGATLFVANSATGEVFVVDAAALTVTATVTGLASPKGMAVVA
ncbi:hypothetical protein [Adlercreutzia caecimuris]|uniref:hypothetical protein n=1 Tax=Adlercreutzia caecimuris TaxID=671266 RepID=UPI00242ED443|nr:hypothetical protein [Adlercreutzia caecimuris]